MIFLAYIIRQLEHLAAQLGADNSLTPNVFVSAGIPIDELLKIYNQYDFFFLYFTHSFYRNFYFRLTVMASADRFWLREEFQFHFAKTIAALISLFVDNHHSYSSVDK